MIACYLTSVMRKLNIAPGRWGNKLVWVGVFLLVAGLVFQTISIIM
jgi:hypothetical protein